MRLDAVTQRQVLVDDVQVATSASVPGDVPRLFQLGDDPLDRSLGDADGFSHIAKPDLWVLRHAEEHVRVIGQKRPFRGPIGHNASPADEYEEIITYGQPDRAAPADPSVMRGL